MSEKQQALNRTLSTMLSSIRRSRTALIVAAADDPTVQEILDETHRLEAQIVRYLDRQIDEMLGEDTLPEV